MSKRKCMWCGGEATIELRYARLLLCDDCFKKYFIKRIAKTVEEYRMVREGERIGVFYDGSKPSIALLDALPQALPRHEVHAIMIDMGLPYYTIEARTPLEEIAKERGVEIHVYSLPDQRGYSIEDFRGTKYWPRICSTCALLKRYYSSYVAKQTGLDVLATPHTLDDAVELLLTLLVDGKLEELASFTPVQEPEFPNQVRRVKPLIKTYEWEVEKYIEVSGLDTPGECPLREGARSAWRKEVLARFEEHEPAFLRKMYRSLTKKLSPVLRERYERPRPVPCRICGGPSTTGICGRCVREIYLRDRKKLDIKIG